MDATGWIAFLGVLEKLKINTRHAWTSAGTQETVAAHSWRLATLALLLRGEIPDIDFHRVVAMCLVHDFGEAITGDIPSFEKGKAEETAETEATASLLAMLPVRQRDGLTALFAEMEAMQTREAKLYKALDKLEAVLQHNESPLDTWLPLEYDLQRTYGVEEAAMFPAVQALRAQLLADTDEKCKRAE